MPDFIESRLAFLRGYRTDDPVWVELYGELAPRIHESVASNDLDLFIMSILDGEEADDKLNRAWYSAVHQQAEDETRWIDSYDYDYFDDSDAYYMSAAEIWAQEDMWEQFRDEELPAADIEQEYRYFVRRYHNVWRAGHERRRLRQAG